MTIDATIVVLRRFVNRHAVAAGNVRSETINAMPVTRMRRTTVTDVSSSSSLF